MTDKEIWKGADETSLHAASILVDLDYSVLPCCWPDAEGNCGCGWNHKNQREIGKAPRVNSGIKGQPPIPIKCRRGSRTCLKRILAWPWRQQVW